MRIATAAAAELALGDSVAVNGVCLTVVRFDASGFDAEVSPETLRVTNLGDLRDGATVNLERPLLPSDRLGGHFVQGHVDGVGSLAGIEQETDFWWVTVRFPEDLSRYLVPKGSVAVDGISLTVAGLEADSLRGADRPAHLAAHESPRPARRRRRQHRVRYHREVRRPRRRGVRGDPTG